MHLNEGSISAPNRSHSARPAGVYLISSSLGAASYARARVDDHMPRVRWARPGARVRAPGDDKGQRDNQANPGVDWARSLICVTLRSHFSPAFGGHRSILALVDGGQGVNRTPDTRIFSPLLYQLSYLAPMQRRY